MSWVQVSDKDSNVTYVREEKFHRVNLSPQDQLQLFSEDKPIAVWVPSGYRVTVTAEKEVVLDIAEVVEHHDIVSMDRVLREKDRELRDAQRRERQARRRARRIERAENPDRPDPSTP